MHQQKEVVLIVQKKFFHEARDRKEKYELHIALS